MDEMLGARSQRSPVHGKDVVAVQPAVSERGSPPLAVSVLLTVSPEYLLAQRPLFPS